MRDEATLAADTDNRQLTTKEVVELGAVDSAFFCQTFFPRTARQKSPKFHEDIWRLLDSRDRLVDILVFRGAAKTSLLRMFTAKRIAYGLAHTVLYIGKSEGHATRSVRWMRRQIEYNTTLTQTFGLAKGDKWQDIECEIRHQNFGYPIWLMAAGITGTIRGLNMDDFRPDLIVLDDVVDEENAATPEQRKKIENLVYGALKESLAPASEMPDAKLVALQTPLNKEDYSVKALTDPEWASARFGCWTPETEDLPLAQQQSIWPERWPSEVLRREKEASIHRNQLSLWLREKECKLVSPETSTFKSDWLHFYDMTPRENIPCVLAIDPVPPPSDTQIAKGMRGKDYEALAVVGIDAGRYYILEYSMNRGHDPSWTVAEFFRLALKYNPRRVLVESVAYQRTLAWLMRKAMEHQRRFFAVEEVTDRRKKFDRIVDALNGPASNGKLFVREGMSEFIGQFTSYPDTSHDDLLDAVSLAVTSLSGNMFQDSDDDGDSLSTLLREEDAIPALENYRGAP